MNFQKFELHITQVEKAIKACRKKFKNPRKQEIYDNYIALFKKIKKSDYKNYNFGILSDLRKALNIIFSGVEYLNYRREKDLPEELLFCLNLVLAEWLPNSSNDYFIVISYNNTLDQFFFKAYNEGFLQKFNLLIKNLFDLSYKESLIQISKPKFLLNDFLGSVPIYHEIGHFVDRNYQIIENLFLNPSFLQGLSAQERECAGNHYAEYFADIFAAQYVGRAAMEPLSYAGYGLKDCHTHPSTEKRVRVTEAFLQGTGDSDSIQIIEYLKKATLDRTNLELKIRNAPLIENPFILLSPVSIDKQGVHGLIVEGWNQWLDVTQVIHTKYPKPSPRSTIINKIIKESIRLSMET
jgi:hypothetical protein